MPPGSFKKVLPYALVVFFGYVGFSMPLPMLPEMFLDSEVGILSSSYSKEFKMILLGVVMAAYPFGQLIGAPILGKCSDKWGRKKIILLSLLGSMVGYVFTAIATSYSHTVSIFLGLFLCGLCEGNVAIAQSVVADLAAQEGDKAASDQKISYFGWINLFACFAFIIGPILGGQLSDSSTVSWFTFSTPFWIAAVMTLIGVGIVIKFSEETKKLSGKEPIQGYWKSFKEGMKQKKLRKLYFVNFFLALGYFSYFRFFPVYVENKFSFDAPMLGYVIAYGSLMFAIFSATLLKPVARFMSAKNSVALFSFLLGLSFFVLIMPDFAWSLLFTIPPVDVCLAVVMTYSAVLISDSAPHSFQGQAFGMLTSVQVAAEVLTGLFGGILAGYHTSLPMMIGSFMLIIASTILFTSKKLRN